ncbi:MAG: alcohol dehydrogenase catalytic domain-containing protein [Chromatiales bacterium]|jgi:(R,R)-butanediol dehydrogenase/meso-butanediol dehydrogenase/diacetyl reductase
MSETTRGCILTGDKQTAIEERKLRAVGPTDAIVKVDYCGICGSDLHGWSAQGAVYAYGTLMGHEATGTVAEVGKDVKRLKPGDRVAINGFTPCGECVACRNGIANACVHNMVRTIGQTPELDGAFADYIWLPDVDVTAVKMPDELTSEEGAFTEPAATVVHAIRISPMKAGDTVAVVGAGPIGLLCASALQAAGAGKVIVSQSPGPRADLAKQFGADAVINPRDPDNPVGEQIRELTDGGADVVIECAGSPPALQQSIDMARPGGEVILVGVNERETPIIPTSLMFGEVSMRGSLAWNHKDFRIAVDFMASGQVDVKPLISDVIALDAIQTEGFERLKSDRSLIKVLVKP